MVRFAVHVLGIVQGVGFRPFVYTAATRRGLSGWVGNRTDGVHLEVQGVEPVVRDFLETLRRTAPPAAHIEQMEAVEVVPQHDTGFHIVASMSDAATRPTLPADLTICADCLAEVQSPAERRYRYPFTNCTRCGPRYSIIEALPYDRARTVMQSFPLCPACAAEYGDPADRRFHAQPVACPSCGPTLRLLDASGHCLATHDAALAHAAQALLSGRILALKGLGGFQLLVVAADVDAVTTLRQRKGREEKPFAVMFPTLAAVRSVCAVSDSEAAVLASSAAPIVLLRRLQVQRPPFLIADAVAPGNPRLGVMLPYTPLHHLLLDAAVRPLVCTSGNLSEEPMCIDEHEALDRLGRIADVFLVHDRPIVRPLDDSVVQVSDSGPQILRRARGFAPLPLSLGGDGPCVLALGGHLKSTVALATHGEVVVSQHLGDLSSVEAALLLERAVSDLVRFFEARIELVACDLHPDYVSTRLAERLASQWNVPLLRVQHHHAHVAAAMAEHGLRGPVLGLAWDGAGLGTDGTLWGGEALVVDGSTFERVAHMRSFALPGGEQAMRQPRRAAFGILHGIFGADAVQYVAEQFSTAEATMLMTLLDRQSCVAPTTSIGRLFDAVAALTRIRSTCSFEGQAAMELEWAADDTDNGEAYPFPLLEGEPAVADFEPLIRAVLRDREAGVPAGHIAARLHNALASLAEAIAYRVGLSRVVLAGGCFQNQRLAQAIRARLQARGFAVYVPQRYPPNDGGLSLGQAWVALHDNGGHV